MAAKRVCLLAFVIVFVGGISLPARPVASGAPRLRIANLPGRCFAGSSAPVRVILEGAGGAEARVEVSTLVAGRAIGQTVWEVLLEAGTGSRDIPLPLPEARSRVSLDVVAKLLSSTSPATARAQTTVMPRWEAGRLAEVLRTREVGVIDREKVVAPALDGLPFTEIAAGDPLGVDSFRGDMLICHLPRFSLVSDGVVTALRRQLRRGRSVLWLVPPDEQRPPLLHSGPLVTLEWPFVLRPGQELASVPPDDLRSWASGESVLPSPALALIGKGRIVVCSDQILTDLAREPAAGWLWEAILAWLGKPGELRAAVKRIEFGDVEPLSAPPGSEPVAALLALHGDEWLQADEQHLEWLGRVARFVEKGNALLVTGADRERMTALRALGLPPVELLRVERAPDLLLGPSLLLWGIARVDIAYGLLTPRGSVPLAEALVVGDQGGGRLLAEYAAGKGTILLCQANLDQSTTGADAALLEHLALQLLGPAGQSALVPGAGP